MVSGTALVLGLVAASPSPALAETVFDDDFESAPLGEAPPGWSVTDDGGPVVVSNLADDGAPDNRAMCVTRDTVNTPVSAANEFDADGDVVTIDTRLRAAQTDALFYGPTLRDSFGNTIIQLGLQANGRLGALTSGWTNFTPYSANTWYDLRIVADIDAETYDVYWDGEQVAQAQPFKTTADDLADIRFNPYAWTEGQVCYDGVAVDSEDTGSGLPPDSETFLTPGELATEISNGVYAPVRHAGDVAEDIDLGGDFDQWRQFTGINLPANDEQNKVNGWDGPDDLSAEAYFTYDGENFYLGVQVTDDVHEAVAGNNWNGDGLQFAFADTAFGSFRSEFGVALVDGEFDIQRFADGIAVDPPEVVEADFRRDGDLTTYAMRIPWTAVMSGPPEAGARVPFTVLANENDGAGRDGWLEWTPGIGDTKDVGQYARAELLDSGETWSAWLAGATVVDSGDEVQLSLLAPNFGEAALDLVIDIPAADVAGHAVTVPAGEALHKTFTITVEESLDVAATITGAGQSREPTHHVDALLSAAQLLAMFNDLEDTVLPGLRDTLEQAAAADIDTDYETVNADTIELFIPYGRQDIDNDRRGRAQYIAETLYDLAADAQQALDAYLDGSAEPFEVPRYVTGPTEVEDYSMIGDTTAGPDQPIFFTGYGMFNTVFRDLPKYPGLGTNVVDHVFGPNEVIVPPDQIEGWSRSGTGNARIALDDTDPHEGERALKFTSVSGRNSLVQGVPSTPGETYEFSAWIKAEEATSPRIISRNFGFVNYLPTGTYDWQQVSFEVDAEDFSTLNWRLWQEEPGTIWMDDARITLVGDDENLLVNGDFEEGDTIPAPFGVDMSAIDDKLLPALEDAEENNVAVNLTIGPHRWPSWTHNVFPDIRNDDTLFAHRNYDVEHPVARDILKTFVEVTIEAIKDSPALQSVTLTSEPVYLANYGKYHTANWRAHLAEVYQTIDAVNDRWGTSYGSFEEVEVPDMAQVTGSPRYYDYLTFKEGQFLEYHQMLKEAVRTHAPDLPTHIKIMGWGAQENRNALRDWAVDVEAFSGLTEISGNDNGSPQETGSAGMLDAMMLYDTQASLARQPIFNSEDHVITDGDERYIPQVADSVANQLWTGGLHGRALTTLWLWDRSYNVDLHPYMQGSILNRPDAIASVGHVNLDLNRLAHEVTSFVEQPADVALLYSRTPLLYSDPYWSAMRRAYSAMSYTGQHVGFVSENQIGAGDLDDYRLLVLPEVTNLSAATLAEIRAWQDAGGRIVTVGDPAALLAGDEYDDPLPAGDRDAVLSSPRTIQVPGNPSEDDLREVFFDELATLGLDRVIVYHAATGEPAEEVEWRFADHDGETLLSLVNLSEHEKEVYVEVDGDRVTPARELISDTEPGSSTLPVDSLGHYLYELAEPVVPACEHTGLPPDEQPTVVVRGVDSGVPNYDAGDGCTINDLIVEDWPNHGDLMRHVVEVTGELEADGVITGRERGAIIRAAAKSDHDAASS